MLLGFACSFLGKRLERITFVDLNRATVIGFLDAMERKKNWAPSTRNHRLGCIRSFFRFASYFEPMLVIHLEELKGIPLKKTVDKSRTFDFLSQEAMATVLRQPDASTKMGARDMFFMVLMYDAAARDCEMLSMLFKDINVEKRTAYLLGKGSKPRLVPISVDTVRHFIRYAKMFHPSGDGDVPMFYTVRHNEKAPMSDDNVARFMRKYGIDAKSKCLEMPDRIHPHMFRRSRAMHLYRSGVPLALLAEWLGHENPETTLIYAYADTEMKRKAIEKAETGASVRPDAETAMWEDNEDLIKKLCGLS
jgi:site-specific recombinase XerD